MSKKVSKTEIYIGPTIIGVATKNQVFNNGLPAPLKKAIEEEPIIEKLVVTTDKLSNAMTQISQKNGAMYVFYTKALEYKNKKGAV